MNKKITDNELEKIFKLGTEDGQFEYDPNAWSQMEILLNKEKKKKRFIFWFTLIGVSTILFGTFYIFMNARGNNQHVISPKKELIGIKKINSNQSKVVTGLNEKKLSKKESTFINTKNDRTNDTNRFNNNSKELKQNNVKVSKNELSQVGFGKDKVLKEITSKQKAKQSSLPQKLNKGTVNIEKTKSKTPISNEFDDKNLKDIELKESSDLKNEMVNDMIYLTQLEFLKPKLIWKNRLTENLELSQVQVSDSNNNNKNERPLFLMLAAGRRYTATPATNLGNGDNIYSLGLGFGISRHLAVTLQGSYTEDVYQAGYEDYLPYKGYWTRGIKPSYTNATCNILNINMGLKYFVNNQNKSGPYAGLGISSIFMLKESYYYKINDPGADIKRKWYGNNDSQDYFSIFDFNAGYQFKATTRMKINISGNYEIPLYGIGHGNVKMSGSSVSLGLNYKLN